jgi:antirestriction protein ArdC
MTASALRVARSRWFAADPRITDERAKAVLASAFESVPGSVEHRYYTSILLSLPQGMVPGEALIAATDGNSSESRSARARRQRRDRKGRFAYQGGGIRALIRRLNGEIFSISGRVVANAKNSRDVEVEFPDGKIAEVNPTKGEYIKAVLPTPDGYSPEPITPSVTDEVIDEKDLVFVDAPNGWIKDESFKDENAVGPVERYVDSNKEFVVYISKDTDGTKNYNILNAKNAEIIDDGKNWADIQDILEGKEDQFINFKAKLPSKEKMAPEPLPFRRGLIPAEDRPGPNAYEKLMAEKKDKENAIANRKAELKKNADDRVDALDRDVPEGWDIEEKNNADMLRRATEPADLENVYKQDNFVARVVEQGEISVKDKNNLLEDKVYQNWAYVDRDKDARATEYAQKAREEIKNFAPAYGYKEEDLNKIDAMSADEIASFFLDEKLQPEGFADALDDYMTSAMVDAPSKQQEQKWKSFGEKLKVINDAGDFPGDNKKKADLPKQPDAPVETKGAFEFNYPAGAYKIRPESEYDIQGRVDEESTDFTDDPIELAQKQDERDILAALEQAVSPGEDGENALGVGALPFNKGDEFVPAEALFFALQEAGMDAPMELAKIYDKKLGADNNEKALNDFRKKAEIVSGNIPELAESFKKVTEQNPDLEPPTQEPKFDPKEMDLIPLPPLLEGLSEKELEQFNETKDHTPYLPKNEEIEMPEGYNPLSPEPFAAWKEVTAENPDPVLPEGFSDNPVFLAQEIPTDDLLKELRRSVEPGNEVPGAAVIALPTDDGEDFVANVPGEAVRDALQLKGIDTNAELEKIAEEGREGQKDEPISKETSDDVITLTLDGDVSLENQIRDAIADKKKIAFLYNETERVVLPTEIFENPKNGNINVRAIDANGDKKTFTLSKIGELPAKEETSEISDKEIFDRRMAGESLQEVADDLGITREEVRAREAKYARENPELRPEETDVTEKDQVSIILKEEEDLADKYELDGLSRSDAQGRASADMKRKYGKTADEALLELSPEESKTILDENEKKIKEEENRLIEEGSLPAEVPTKDITKYKLTETGIDEVDINGTSLQGNISATSKQLEAVFGKPDLYEDEKVKVLWAVKFDGPDGEEIASIYDWKNDNAPGDEEVYDWHIGGNSPLAVELVKNVFSPPEASKPVEPVADSENRDLIFGGDISLEDQIRNAIEKGIRIGFFYNGSQRLVTPVSIYTNFKNGNVNVRVLDENGDNKTFTISNMEDGEGKKELSIEDQRVLDSNEWVQANAGRLAPIFPQNIKEDDYLWNRFHKRYEKVISEAEYAGVPGAPRFKFGVFNPKNNQVETRYYEPNTEIRNVRRIGEAEVPESFVAPIQPSGSGKGPKRGLAKRKSLDEPVFAREGRKMGGSIKKREKQSRYEDRNGVSLVPGDVVRYYDADKNAVWGRGVVKSRIGAQTTESGKVGGVPRGQKVYLGNLVVQWENEDKAWVLNQGGRGLTSSNVILQEGDNSDIELPNFRGGRVTPISRTSTTPTSIETPVENAVPTNSLENISIEQYSEVLAETAEKINPATEKIANSIIEALERGTAPWRKPWTGGGFLPTSVSTGKTYEGSNILVLWAAQEKNNWTDNRWLTFIQAQKLGGNIKRGEKGTQIVHWQPSFKEVEQTDGTKKEVSVYLPPKVITVFNVEQAENINLPALVKADPVPVTEAETKILDSYKDKPEIKNVPQDRAYYDDKLDIIRLPQREQFTNPKDYLETLIHELAHSTGNKNRLNRSNLLDNYANHLESRGEEELIAEIAVSLAAARLGVEIDFDNVASYAQSWLRPLKNDKTMIVKAAKQAQKAVDYMLGKQEEPVKVNEERVLPEPVGEGVGSEGKTGDQIAEDVTPEPQPEPNIGEQGKTGEEISSDKSSVKKGGNGLDHTGIIRLAAGVRDSQVKKLYDAEMENNNLHSPDVPIPVAPKINSYPEYEDYVKAFRQYQYQFAQYKKRAPVILLSDVAKKHLDGTTQGLQNYINEIVESDWFLEKFGDGGVVGIPEATVRPKGPQGQHSLGTQFGFGYNRIFINARHAKDESTILHEIAHYATAISATSKYAGHGKEFARNHLDISKNVIGSEYEDTLKKQYRKAGVRFE